MLYLEFFFDFLPVCSRTSRRMETIFSFTSVSDGRADTVGLSAHHQVQQRSVQPLPGRLQSPMANVHRLKLTFLYVHSPFLVV